MAHVQLEKKKALFNKSLKMFNITAENYRIIGSLRITVTRQREQSLNSLLPPPPLPPSAGAEVFLYLLVLKLAGVFGLVHFPLFKADVHIYL